MSRWESACSSDNYIDLIGHRHLSTLPNHAPTRLPQTHPFAMIANRFGGAQLPRPCGSVEPSFAIINGIVVWVEDSMTCAQLRKE